MQERVDYDEETGKYYLVTQDDDGTITNEPITAIEAAKWNGENKW